MCYWVLFKNGKYVSDVNDSFTFNLSEKIEDAIRFYNFSAAMQYIKFGFAVMKEYR